MTTLLPNNADDWLELLRTGLQAIVERMMNDADIRANIWKDADGETKLSFELYNSDDPDCHDLIVFGHFPLSDAIKNHLGREYKSERYAAVCREVATELRALGDELDAAAIEHEEAKAAE